MTGTSSQIRYVDLVDVEQLQGLMESFNEVIGIANAVIDIEGNVIAHAGWQDACTQFHRCQAEACKRCVDSDTSLVKQMTQGKHYAVYNCLNGLVDTASPIIVNGQHVANVFTGQFLSAPPDFDFFRNQAKEFGFPEDSYLEAIRQVPVIPVERVKPVTELYARLASLLATNGMDRLKERQTANELRRMNEVLEERVATRTQQLAQSEKRQRALIDASPVPKMLYDEAGNITYVNDAFTRCFGYEKDDIPTLDAWRAVAYPDASYRHKVMRSWRQHLKDAQGTGGLFAPLDIEIVCKDSFVRSLTVEEASSEALGLENEHLVVFHDLTAQKRAQAELKRQKEYLQAIYRAEPECVAVISKKQGRLEEINPAGLAMFEIAHLEEALETGLMQYIVPSHRDAMKNFHERICSGESGVLELPITGKKGRKRWLEIHGTALRDDSNSIIGTLAVARDVTERRHLELQLRKSEERYRVLIEAANEGIVVVQGAGTISYVNPKLLELWGSAEHQVLGRPVIDFIHPDDQAMVIERYQHRVEGKAEPTRYSFRIVTQTRGIRWFEINVVRFEWDDAPATLSFLTDITEQRANEEAIRQMAFYDRLTNLPNRRLLEDRLQQAITLARRARSKVSLMFIDLDKFKPINDQFGHDVGDWLLQQVAARMQECVRRSDTVARIGGDEFIVLLPDADNTEAAVKVAEKIRTTLEIPFQRDDGRTLNISSSIGVAFYPNNADTARDLLRYGDEAMYQAKKSGRNAVVLFAAEQAAAQARISPLELHWNTAYASGDSTIDREHQELFQHANDLLEKAASPGGSGEEFREAFARALQHIEQHFEHEEAILRQRAFPGLEEHMAKHRLLIEHAHHLKEQSEKAQISEAQLIEFLVSEVIAGHLRGEDQKFFYLFSQ